MLTVRGAWEAQSVECPTSAQVMSSWFMGSSPASGLLMSVCHWSARFGSSVSLSLCSFLAYAIPKINKTLFFLNVNSYTWVNSNTCLERLNLYKGPTQFLTLNRCSINVNYYYCCCFYFVLQSGCSTYKRCLGSCIQIRVACFLLPTSSLTWTRHWTLWTSVFSSVKWQTRSS